MLCISVFIRNTQSKIHIIITMLIINIYNLLIINNIFHHE